MSYFYLFIAIVGEILGTNLLKLSDGFTKPIPTVSALLSYGVCFYFLSLHSVHYVANVVITYEILHLLF